VKLVIYAIYSGDGKNLFSWKPEDDLVFIESILMDIGEKNKKGADLFSIRIATPEGLKLLKAEDGILAARPLIIVEKYDFNELWTYLNKIVLSCEADSWSDCVEKLRYHFNWEYDGYR